MNKISATFALLLALCPGAFSQNKQVLPENRPAASIVFTENKGQFHDQESRPRPDVLFGAMAGPMSVQLKTSGVSYQLFRTDSWRETADKRAKIKRKEIGRQTVYRVDLNWVNPNADFTQTTDAEYPGLENFYLENCPSGVLDVKSYKGVTLHNLFDGISIHYYDNGGQLKCDYLVSPHADYHLIRLNVDGATVKLNANGSVTFITPLGTIEESAPVAYQNGKQLQSKWKLSGQVLSFEITNYDPAYALLIDPVVRNWGTYYGGTGDDGGYSTTTDASGNVYIAGASNTSTALVIATSGAHQATIGGSYDAYFAKFNSSGVRQLATYYGGSGDDYGYYVRTDASGNIYLAGNTTSAGGTAISTGGSHQTAFGGSSDAFLVKFNSSGVRQWGTYYGGDADEAAYYCATDASGNIFLTGFSSSSNGTTVATSGSHQATNAGGFYDAFLVKFNSSGVRQWGTYYGGPGEDAGYCCAADASGNIYMTGYTDCNTGTIIASVASHQASFGGGTYEGYLVKFNGSGVRQWGTYYGGTGQDYVNACTIDPAGDILICGSSSSAGTAIATSGSHQPANAGGDDAFLAKFSSSGARQWGSFYGGTNGDYGQNLCTDASSNIYLAGYTASASGISTSGSHQVTFGGGISDGFFAEFNSSGVRQWGTYYGGNADDYGYACSADASGNSYLSGYTNSANGTSIASPGSHQSAYGTAPYDGFLAQFASCAVSISSSPSNTNVCVNNNISFSIVASGATSYQWEVNCGSGWNNVTNTGVYSGATTATLTITGATSGMNGCQYRCNAIQVACTATSSAATLSVSVPVLTPFSQTNISCSGGSNGAAAVNPATGGIASYIYNWTPGNPAGDGTTAASGLTAGSWTCTVTDAIGCTAAATFTITAPTAISVTAASQTNVACNGGANGTAAINTPTDGAGGYVYNWTPGNPTGDGTVSVTGLTAGTWTCTVTDANSCTATQTFSITAPSAIAVSVAAQTDVSCNGGSNGTAAINTPTGGTGGYTYNWTPGNPTGDGTVSVTNLTAGTWTCTVTDASGCTAVQTFNITQPTAIVVSTTQTNTNCYTSCTGTAMATPTGGTAPYVYVWNPPGATSPAASNLCPGSYTCTVTDQLGCVGTATISITSPPPIAVTPASQTNISCNGGSTGAAAINTPTGGTGGYTYNWTPGNPTGDGTVSVSGLTAGTWTCTVTDASSCTAAQTFSITQPTAISVTAIAQTNISCNGGSNGSAAVSVSGGAGGYTYSWAPAGGTAATAAGLTAAVYTVTVTDANNCTATQTFNITEPAVVVATAVSQTAVSCNGGSNGSAAVSASGGTGGYTYSWAPAGGTAATAAGLTAGGYTVTVTDANNCTASATFSITEPPAISLSAMVTNASGCTSNDGAIDQAVSGGSPGYTFLWSNGAVTEDISLLDGGTYSVTVTDANACTATAGYTITEPGAPAVSYSEPMDTVCQATQVPFNLSGASPAGGTWSGPGVTGNAFDPMTASIGFNYITYSYTDGGGCSGSAVDSIYVDLCMNLPVNSSPASIGIYPNPTGGGTVFASGLPCGSRVQFELLDGPGRILASAIVLPGNSGTSLAIPENLAAGLYYVRFKNDSFTKVLPLMIVAR